MPAMPENPAANDGSRASSSTISGSRSTAPQGGKIYCGAKPGDYFELRGEMLHLPPGQGFSIYSLAALLPLLPAKQRPTDPNDWMIDRRRGRLPRSELPDPVPHHADGQAPVQPCATRPPCRSPKASNVSDGRPSRSAPATHLPRHPRRLAAGRRPRRRRPRRGGRATSSPSPRRGSPPSTAPTSIPASRS